MENDKLHVIFFPAWYPHRGDPMPGLFVKHHAQALLPYARVSILQVLGEERKHGELLEFDYKVEEGLPTMRVYYRKNKGTLGKLLDFYLYFSGTIKGYSLLAAKTGKADLHHVHVLTRAGFLPWLMKKTSGIPYLVTEHWSRYQAKNRHLFKGSLRKWLTRQVVSNASAICPVNVNLGNAMLEMGFYNPNYVPVNNVVDLKRFTPAAVPVSPNRLLHVSCFDEKAKNTKGLLRAFKEALKTDPTLFLTLVGDGPDWQMTRDYVSELNLLPFVHFTGILEGNELVEAFRQNSVLLMFSNYENQPVVILEAFACGLPVISSSVGGIPEMLAQKRGVLVEAGDEKAYTEALLQFQENPGTATSGELRHYVEENYSFDTIGRKYSGLYNQALKSKK